MAKRLALAVTVSALVGGCGNILGQASFHGVNSPQILDGQDIPGELVVQLKAGAELPPVPGARAVDQLDLGDLGSFVRIKVNPRQVKDVSALLTRQAVVVTVTPNRRVVVPVPVAKPSLPGLEVRPDSDLNDPWYTKQWYLPRIGADRAWAKTKGEGVVVAVVDTGVDYTHPDLKDQVVSKGFSFVSNTADGIDEHGHGTHVAGTIAAAQNNGEGVSGVAPGARILPIQVLSASGAGTLYDIAKGIKYGADYGVQHKVRVVVNLSLGGGAVVDPVSYTTGWYATGKGALLVAAAGNSNGAVGTPARWDKYYTAISALDERDDKASFSNFGPEISVAAPGTNIMATTPSYDVPLNHFGFPKYYAALQGTSMACPIVAATSALVWSIHPDWTWQQVRKHLEATAKDLGNAGKDHQFGYGMVQPATAVGL